MRTSLRHGLISPSISFALLALLLACLWIAGGAARADVFGQSVVRGAAAGALVLASLFASPPALSRWKFVAILLALAVVLALVQLVPMPPLLWEALPGREILSDVGGALGRAQPWRPWSIIPGATVNAAASLLVPVAVLMLASSVGEAERRWISGALLIFVTASMLVGLLQFTGAGIDNPLVNDVPGLASGTFANRNHFALLLALGCLLVPAWVFSGGRRPGWRGPAGLGLALLFALTILATGSRAGMALGIIALTVALGISWRGLRHEMRRRPRWIFPALVSGIVGLLAAFVVLAVVAGRAVSLDRLLAEDVGEDMRGRALPTVLKMIQDYFPAGTGLGGFDGVFRIHEPADLLKSTYFNHAHNDFLEIMVDSGLPGALLLLAAVMWWGSASVRAWRAGNGADTMLPKVGSAMIGLILAASVVDYPARTPTMMAVIVIAAMWLGERPVRRGPAALPGADQHL